MRAGDARDGHRASRRGHGYCRCGEAGRHRGPARRRHPQADRARRAVPGPEGQRQLLDLQREISDVEDHIQYARRYYNGAVRNLNTRIDTFPDNLVAKIFRFNPAAYFDPDGS
ncbi:MAG: LemA family protein [Gammaproteobacteria bacterium]|nr:LemA family protein [Gammaproteobacteria bacterium]